MHRGREIYNRFLDTNMLWVVISLVLAAAAPVFHVLAIQFDLYGNPPHPDLRIDVYTHSLSAIAVVALLLNLNLGEKRRWSWGVPIAFALAVGIFWEGFEEVVIRLDLIAFYNSPWNALQDVYIDLLGGIVAAFFYDVVVEHGRHPGEGGASRVRT